MSANTYTPMTNTLSHSGHKCIHKRSSSMPRAGLRYCFSSRDSLDCIRQKPFPNVLQKHMKTSSLRCNTHPRLYWSSAVRMFLIRILYYHRTRLALDMSHSTSVAHGTALRWWKQHFYMSGRVILLEVFCPYMKHTQWTYKLNAVHPNVNQFTENLMSINVMKVVNRF